MGQRGPKPKTNIQVLDPPKKRWPNPAPGMTANARATWHRVVRVYDRDHFKPQHYDLLRAFCEASSLHRKAVLETKKTGEVIKQSNGVEKRSPWIDIIVQMNSSMTSLATKLGITVNSTLAARGKKGNATKPKSGRGDLINGGRGSL